MLDAIVSFVLSSKKAIAAWLAATVVAFLVAHGVQLPDNSGQVFEALASALVVGVVTWFTRNRVGAVNRAR